GKHFVAARQKSSSQAAENERGGAPENFPGREGALGKGQSRQIEVNPAVFHRRCGRFRGALNWRAYFSYFTSSKSAGWPEAESLASHTWNFPGSTSQRPL